mgnify:CR=1 FL=1
MPPRGRLAALLLVLLMASMPWAPATPAALPFSESFSTVGVTSTIVIGAADGGQDDRVEVDVDDGRSIARVDLTLESAALGRSTGADLSGASDFDAPGAVYEGMDVNGSTLSILPDGAFWDFEDPNHGWTLGGSNVWKRGFDSTLGSTGGVSSGSNALYTYDGNYPNGMSTTYWATSPDLACNGCSGTWELSFMRRLGVEYNYYDHAYVQVKNAQGNWAQIWQNPAATMNEGTFTSQTLDISNYVAGNPAFAVRFGLGTSDGSATYTGWNIDDVRIEPNGGATGTGEGSWTSAPFGPEVDGAPHARLTLDASVPGDAVLEATILDALTGTPVPGFTDLDAMTMDLGAIDAADHPLLRIHLEFEEGTAGSPSVGSIAYGGRMLYDLEIVPLASWTDASGSDPASAGAFNAGSGVFTGVSTYTSPLTTHRSGIGAIRNSCDLTNGVLELRLDGGSWTEIQDGGGLIVFESIAHTAELRIRLASGSNAWTLKHFEVDLLPSPAPSSAMVDIGTDGTGEWGLVDAAHGRLGLQDRLMNGAQWTEGNMVSGSDVTFPFYLPSDGLQALSFMVDLPSTDLNRLDMELHVGGNTAVPAFDVRPFIDEGEVHLPTTDLAALNNALNGRRDAGPSGLDLVEVEAVFSGLSNANAPVIFGGLFAPYDAVLSASLSSGHPLVVALNGALGEAVPSNGVRTVALPVSLAAPGAVQFTVDDLRTTPSVEVTGLSMTPDVNTLVPGNDWYRFNASFDATRLGTNSFASDMRNQNWDVRMVLYAPGAKAELVCSAASLPLTGSELNSCASTGKDLVWTNGQDEGHVALGGSGADAWVDAAFQIPVSWGDETSAVFSLSLVSPAGPMLPASRTFGAGSAMGIEPDVGLEDWWIQTSSGYRAHPSEPWLAPGDVGTINIQVGFEDLPDAARPRSGDVLVRARLNGVDIGTTSSLVDGHASFPFTAPSFVPEVDVRIDVEPLRGQDRADAVDSSMTFGLDGVSPLLLSSSTAATAHLEADEDHEHSVLIGDRPRLPSRGDVHLWRSWVDDTNGNGAIDFEEATLRQVSVPANLTDLQGHYAFTMDASRAPLGGWYAFWYDIADQAGNVLLDAGNRTMPMSIVQVNQDAAPVVGDDASAFWSVPSPAWLHPSELVTLSVPLGDGNGLQDLAKVIVDLDLDRDDGLLIEWSTEDGCSESHPFLTVVSCDMEGQPGSSTPFSSEGYLRIHMHLDWGFDPSTTARTPSVTVEDRGGQFSTDRLDGLRWRASSELALDLTDIDVDLDGAPLPDAQAQIRPEAELDVRSSFAWTRSGRTVLQPLDVEASLGMETANTTTFNGTFSVTLTVPDEAGSQGLQVRLLNAPDGAVLRGADDVVRRFMVDTQPPRVSALTSPALGAPLPEADWGALAVDVRMDEDIGLGEAHLGWRVMVSGFGLAGEVLGEGLEPMTLRGARSSGSDLPLRAVLDLNSTLAEDIRTQRLELRVWVEGVDLSGQPVDPLGNSLADPLAVWLLEQRVAEVVFDDAPTEDLLNPVKGGELIWSYTAVNLGRGPGDVQIIVEVVEADGSRTRLDARSLSIAAGETGVRNGTWVPLDEGPVRFEYIIVDGTTHVGDTHLIAASGGQGLFGGPAGGVGSVLVLVVVAMIGVAAYRLSRERP